MFWTVVFWMLVASSVAADMLILLDRSADIYRLVKLAAAAVILSFLAVVVALVAL